MTVSRKNPPPPPPFYKSELGFPPPPMIEVGHDIHVSLAHAYTLRKKEIPPPLLPQKKV